MGALIRNHDWTSTPLGPPSQWAQSLRTAVRLMLNTQHPIYIFWGETGACLYNDAYRQSIGVERHPNSLGHPAKQVWEEIWPIIGPQIEQVMAGRGATWHENQLVPITRDGLREDVYWTYSYGPIDDEEVAGGVGGVLVICSETTTQVRAAARLKEQARRQQILMQQMPGFVGVLRGPTHVYEYVNDAYVALSGRTGFLGRTVRDAFPELEGQGFFELLDDVYTSGKPYAARAAPIHLAGEDDERYIDLLYEPIRDETGTVIGVFVGGYDATEQIRAQRALRDANAMLEGRIATAVQERKLSEAALVQSQKMQAVGQLTGGLAHDFNNLLMVISGSLQLVNSRITQGRTDEIARYVAAAQGATKRAASLTHRLLAFSRQQTLEPKITDVNRLVMGMEELVRRTMVPGVEVEVVKAGGLWLADVDPGQLENALLNLCINARDAMPSGGKLTIETANRWLDARAAQARDLPPGQYLSLCVSDNGTGMEPDTIARAFDPFFTTKPIGQGTGLGLSMVYGFARQSGGQARIYSENRQGTMVCIYLPRYLGDQASADDEASNTAGLLPIGTRATVLVVDDEPTIRMLILDVLEEMGLVALEAGDGAAAIRVVQSGERIDLLITDVGLPGGMNGRQVADVARSMRPHLKVLFITGFAENAVLSHCHLDPGMHVLTKPFDVEMLAERVRTLIVESGTERR
ncbi:MAG: response regulator [Rhizobacter sp.]|nr:response regulator [Rhizobacter sp.]